jgi:hypothetical protein
LGWYNTPFFNRHSATKNSEVMSTSMFVTGFIIFSIYLAFLIWNIYNGNPTKPEENTLDGGPDPIDMDGMGNFSRFPKKKGK